MATLLANTFEGGTDGANITVANSGGASGDAFGVIVYNNVSVGSSGNAGITYSASSAKQGSLGVNFIPAANTSYLRHDVPVSETGTRIVSEVTLRFPSNPAATFMIMRAHSSSNASLGALILRTDGRIAVYDATNVEITASRMVSALAANTDYIAALAVQPGTTTANGTLEYRIYDSSHSTVLFSWSSTAVNAGTTAPAFMRYFGPVATSGWSAYGLDMTRSLITDNASAWIAVFPDANATVSAPVAVIDATSSTGATISLSITQVSGPSGSATQIATGIWRVPVPEDTDTVWRVTASDSNGGTDQTTVTVSHQPAAGSAPVQMLYATGPGVFV